MAYVNTLKHPSMEPLLANEIAVAYKNSQLVQFGNQMVRREDIVQIGNDLYHRQRVPKSLKFNDQRRDKEVIDNFANRRRVNDLARVRPIVPVPAPPPPPPPVAPVAPHPGYGYGYGGYPPPGGYGHPGGYGGGYGY
eukprot:NODE_690_length_745_cov_1000.456897_g625_i0.p1 GENE.NODE_690_length_745_cov_1000.456897_g625_i0~~NODE_690_length_745_cov_1000.456897_g625_i0.p1  ORF type:complete len:137 (-),score=30.95 NODE_690_length_745_cov_1000.456897_g625_i0:242-652(-)